MKKLLSIIALFLILSVSNGVVASPQRNEAASAPTYNYTLYEGSIGQYPITMFLDIDLMAKSNNAVVGYYYYNKYPKNRFTLRVRKFESVNMHGTMEVVLYEYNYKGTHSSTFKGSLELRGGSFYGKFVNYKGKVFNFSLMS